LVHVQYCPIRLKLNFNLRNSGTFNLFKWNAQAQIILTVICLPLLTTVPEN